MPMRIRARRLLATLLAIGVLATASVSPALAVGVVGDGTDDKVTGLECVRHDGGTDQAIAHCNNGATDPDPDDVAGDGDTDSNDGGNRRQGNEPFAVIDPTDTDTIIAGWNDYSMSDLGAGWQGFAYSRNGGETWTDSFVPGYPADTSAEGQESPLYRRDTEAGDPIAAFDNDGNLYVGGISFNRAGAINGHVYVARYDADEVEVAGAPDYPVDYRFTRIVGRGTPSRNFQGIFQDKPMLEVDRTGGANDGNVYVCWSRFTAFGQNKIFFSRSTDGGDTYSRPQQLTVHGVTGSVQGCDIAIEGDGDVYVTFRTFNDSSRRGEDGLFFARSTNGGASFGRAHLVRHITPYAPNDGTRDCGDGPFVCPSEFVFARIPLEPRSTADQSSATDGVWLVYNEIDAGTIADSDSTYSSAGGGRVGRSVVYVVKSTDNGASWSDPVKIDNAGGVGHQFFPDIDALGGSLAAVWQDSRTDDCYSVQRPMGNTADATACPDDNVVNTFVATSSNGGNTWSSIRVSDVGHQPQYEMFGSRDVPFQGDYNWIAIADTNGATAGGLEAYAVWTDNRDVIPGEDPREAEQDGFDVLQCLIDLGATAASSSYNGPRARSDAPFTGNNCGNAGGVDQNIYGNRVSVP
jgi:hypothetical protein